MEGLKRAISGIRLAQILMWYLLASKSWELFLAHQDHSQLHLLSCSTGVTAVGIPVALGVAGFTGTGIIAGSIAANMMSAAAIANGGGVAAGGLVATLQSIGTFPALALTQGLVWSMRTGALSFVLYLSRGCRGANCCVSSNSRHRSSAGSLKGRLQLRSHRKHTPSPLY